MASSTGSSFIATLAAELPDRIKLQQQFNRLKEEKMRLMRTAEREEELLLKYTGMYKSTKFKIGQLDEQMRAIKAQQEVSDPGERDSPTQEIRMDLTL